MQRVLRWDVPVDDAWHEIGAGGVVHVAARDHRQRPGDLVEVWTLENPPGPGGSGILMRSVTVVGTGHAVPDGTCHVGTAVVPTFTAVSRKRDTDEQIVSMAGLVWHVFAKYEHDEERQALAEEGRRLASVREDLIAQGVDPNELPVPLHPDAVALAPVSQMTEHHLQRVSDEATSLAYWLANELGEHVDDQDGETLTQTVQRLVAVKLAPAAALAVPIEDWTDFRVGDVVVQVPDLSAPATPAFIADLLVRRPGGSS